jgi:ABC-type antimicrobial peptide transport system permease subunit
MPIIPGLSDAGNCRDWKTGVPIDLKKIRAKDEVYWNMYKGSPKAYISLETAQKIWKNRFGQSTAIRLDGERKAELDSLLRSGLLVWKHGFEVKDIKNDGLEAASGGTDFGSLFIGLSFFVLFSSILLSFLLFQLYLGFRKAEIGTLSALGFSFSFIRKLFLTEALILVFTGILIGIPFSIFYNKLILIAINSIWTDIVRTSILDVHIRLISIVLGSLIIAVISIIVIGFILKHFLKQELARLQRKLTATKRSSGKVSFILALILIGLSCVMLLFKGYEEAGIDPQTFFISGFILLPGLIFVFDFLTKYVANSFEFRSFTMRTFLIKRLVDERKRNLLIVSFLSVGIFLIASTGMNRKDLGSNADAASSGTGGYDYFIETTLPVLFDVLSSEAREELNIPDKAGLVQFQVQPGDDASCLNLNKINRPRLIACDPSAFNQRSAFTFVTRTVELDADSPWMTLDQTLADGLIPAIADQTVIQWGLMKKVGDTLSYKTSEGKELKLKLVGGLTNSVFQGNVIISDRHFNQAFPDISGSNIFLVDVADTSSVARNFKEGFRAYGADISSCTDRLMAFYTVENTYLNIFLMLGSLGLIIGTLGLGILIFRITYEQIPEYAILLALGYRKQTITGIVVREKIVLMIISILIGLIPAILNALPTLLSPVYSGIWLWLPSIAVLVFMSGTIFSFLAISFAFRPNLIEALKNE